MISGAAPYVVPASALGGVRLLPAEDLTRVLDDPMPPVTRCITREKVDGAFRGRVTAALAEFGGQAAECDFHVCGSSEMVADAMAVLRELGAGAVVTETF